MIKAILFDLDGTLLPMQQDEFTNAYFGKLSSKFAQYGYNPEQFIKGVWQGTKAMVKNTGTQTNDQVFWQEFATIFGDKVYSDIENFNMFYETEFDSLKECCGYSEEANLVIQTLKEKGYTLVLASNPVFPMIAQKKRMLWAGVNPKDFVWITSYENSSYCKPNVLYYKEIINHLGIEEKECLMVGNDTTEDAAATHLGIHFFLLTNCLLNKERKDISKYRRGGFMQLLDYIENLN